MKSYFEELGGTYTQVGEYLIPDLAMDPQPEGEIGIWGQRRKQYLKQHLIFRMARGEESFRAAIRAVFHCRRK